MRLGGSLGFGIDPPEVGLLPGRQSRGQIGKGDPSQSGQHPLRGGDRRQAGVGVRDRARNWREASALRRLSSAFWPGSSLVEGLADVSPHRSQRASGTSQAWGLGLPFSILSDRAIGSIPSASKLTRADSGRPAVKRRGPEFETQGRFQAPRSVPLARPESAGGWL